jgi:hypothetical protein
MVVYPYIIDCSIELTIRDTPSRKDKMEKKHHLRQNLEENRGWLEHRKYPLYRK